MNTCLLVITDGRAGCLERTMRSAAENLPTFTHHVMVNDCSDPSFADWLDREFGDRFDIVGQVDGKRGFAGAVEAGWERIGFTSAEWVFHLEDDFTFNRPVDIHAMADVLVPRPHLVQMALRRQPWNDAERRAGGIVEQHPDDYIDVHDDQGRCWLEHRRFFTTNPSLYRASLCGSGWPQVPNSEGIFTHQLLADPSLAFGFWGPRTDAPWVTHIGAERVGSGY